MNDVPALLQVSCFELELLFPLTSIVMILSRNNTSLEWDDPTQIAYDENHYSLYSMTALLHHDHCVKEEYVILIHEAAMKFALTVEAVHGVITVGEASYKLPSYLPRQDYITSCHILPNGKLAYEINIMELLKLRQCL